MTENSLHKCEHHACKHSDTPGIVLCPEFDSTFLKRAAVGWKLPLPVHASFIQTAPQVSEGALRKTQLPLPPCVQFAIPRRTRGVKRGSNNGRLCAEVRQVFFFFLRHSRFFRGHSWRHCGLLYTSQERGEIVVVWPGGQLRDVWSKNETSDKADVCS